MLSFEDGEIGFTNCNLRTDEMVLVSLIGFCLLMCSCKTQRLESNVKIKNDVRSDLAYLNENVKISAQNHAYFANEAQRIVIEEVIIATEYDKETGKPIKETQTERTITQDSDKVVAEAEEKGVTEENDILLKHESDFSKIIDSEEKLESESGQKSFGKWFGIVSACFIGIFLVYLWKKISS